MGYKLTRHHRPKPSDLAETLENFAHMWEIRLANGVMAQAAVGLTDEHRRRLLASIDHLTAQLSETRGVITRMADLMAWEMLPMTTLSA